MKTIILATALVASILANVVAAQAASRGQPQPFDGVKFFEDIANRGGQ